MIDIQEYINTYHTNTIFGIYCPRDDKVYIYGTEEDAESGLNDTNCKHDDKVMEVVF